MAAGCSLQTCVCPSIGPSERKDEGQYVRPSVSEERRSERKLLKKKLHRTEVRAQRAGVHTRCERSELHLLPVITYISIIKGGTPCRKLYYYQSQDQEGWGLAVDRASSKKYKENWLPPVSEYRTTLRTS